MVGLLTMEISKIADSSIKIKGKNASVVIDPVGKVEAQIVIATKPEDSLALDKVEGVRLVISGPGEYEAGGVSVTGKKVTGGMTYQIFESNKIMFATSDSVGGVPDDEEFDCLVIEVTSAFKEDSLGSINRKCTVLYGDLALLDLKSENQEKAVKVSLKKTAEVLGKIFLLS